MLNSIINIRMIEENETIPYSILLLADPSKYVIENYIDRGMCYVAEINGDIIGVYVLIWTRPLTMELVNIAVKEDEQGKGIGKALVLDSIRRARDYGAKVLEVGTGNSSLKQLGLYQKCGFRIVGVDKDFFTKHYQEEIIEEGIRCVDMIRLSIEI